MDSSPVLIVLTCLFVLAMSSLQPLQKPDDVSDEMYCLGCEITMKELDRYLRHKPSRGMGETVTNALSRVCDPSAFKSYEYDQKKILKVCKHVIKDEGLEAALITEYGRMHSQNRETSYLEISKKVCGIHLHACRHSVNIGDEEGGGVKYDPNTEKFTIMDGMKVRKVNPVREDAKMEQTELDPLPRNAVNLHGDSHDTHDEL